MRWTGSALAQSTASGGEPRVTAIPTAWMRRHTTPGSPSGPAEHDVDLVYGDDQPEGEGWVPLYGTPVQTATSGEKLTTDPA